MAANKSENIRIPQVYPVGSRRRINGRYGLQGRLKNAHSDYLRYPRRRSLRRGTCCGSLALSGTVSAISSGAVPAFLSASLLSILLAFLPTLPLALLLALFLTLLLALFLVLLSTSLVSAVAAISAPPAVTPAFLSAHAILLLFVSFGVARSRHTCTRWQRWGILHPAEGPDVDGWERFLPPRAAVNVPGR